jgi:hypothetical protein
MPSTITRPGSPPNGEKVRGQRYERGKEDVSTSERPLTAWLIRERTGRAMPSTSTRLGPLRGEIVEGRRYERGKEDISANERPLSTWLPSEYTVAAARYG